MTEEKPTVKMTIRTREITIRPASTMKVRVSEVPIRFGPLVVREKINEPPIVKIKVPRTEH